MPLPKHTVYLTNAQLHRLSGLACDALVGLQINADESDDSLAYGCFVPVDEPGELRHFEIDADGTYRDTT